MRNAFADEITTLATRHPEIVLLSGDIGNRLFNAYKKAAPDRFFNCGVAEANMTGVAAGLSMGGLRPVTYTIAPFNTLRCLEQIRLDICYPNRPVVIVGVGAGLSYAGLGATHHACEDIGLMRMLPNMTVVCPGDAVEVRLALGAALKHNGPVYLRLGKKNEPVVHASPPDFTIGKAIFVRQGSDICILSTGNMLPVCTAAAQRLSSRGIKAGVVSMHTVKPLDHQCLETVLTSGAMMVTVEEHHRQGGLGSAVMEWLSDQGRPSVRLMRFGTPDAFLKGLGSQENARQKLGLTAKDIARQIESAWTA